MSATLQTVKPAKPVASLQTLQTLVSGEDRSVNFVLPSGQEARFVRRTDEYFIVYLSSHNGCNKACRFCHLTQTGQTAFEESSLQDMLDQARLVLKHYGDVVASGAQPPAGRVNFNWMARGEPLASSVVLGQWAALTAGLQALAAEQGLTRIRFNVSTIFPNSVEQPNPALAILEPLNGPHKPVIYYSLYSLDPAFRKRWLPKAEDPEKVLAALTAWQANTGGEVVLHWAFIEGENDSEQTVADIKAAVERHGLKARFNLVRYNPYSTGQGQEPEDAVLQARFVEITQAMHKPGSRIVPRVGFDVKASCGMFIDLSA